MPQITLQELESKLWAAANSLRGPVDPTDFKSYIFPMLFLKRISDTWDYELDLARQKYPSMADADLISFPENFTFQIPDGCHWSDLRSTTENLGNAIQGILDHIEGANQDTLADIFGEAAWENKGKLPEASLQSLIEVFDALKLDPTSAPGDIMGQAYEYLLKQFADETGKKAGEFFTPRPVVSLLAGLVEPKKGDSVYDPTCGSGGMLIEAATNAARRGVDVRTLKLFGQEINLTTSAIGRMNLFLHDISDAQIARGDTLADPKFLNSDGTLRRFNVCIANPPFSFENWDQKAWADDSFGRNRYGTPPAGNADFAFVQHMIASLDEGDGRMAVVLPHGVLFRGGAEKKIRQAVLTEGLVISVIGLAPNLFYNTSIPVCILVCARTNRAELKGSVLFIDASRRFQKGKARNTMSEADVQAIEAAFKTAKDPDGDDGVNVRIVPLPEIESNDYDLSIGRYIKRAAAEIADVPSALAAYKLSSEAFRTAEADLLAEMEADGYDAAS